MAIDYHNMPRGAGKLSFGLRYIMNRCRSWWKFHVNFPWVRYSGFARVMRGTTFVKADIQLGHNVQFGKYCDIAADCRIGNNVLFAGLVRVVGKHDHTYDVPCQTIWNGERGNNGTTIIEDDVWIGSGAVIVGGLTIKRGSIVAAGSVVTKDIPECEIWGGVPAKKIKDRFPSEEEKQRHLAWLNNHQGPGSSNRI